jgi:uncharacterized protein (DUF3084 family)
MLDREDWVNIIAIVLGTLVTGVLLGLFINTSEQRDTIEQLETELVETREQLNIANDQLKQINMRNEAIYYIKQLEEQEAIE